MIAIGLHAKLQVIAEGIESELHRDLLTAMGCEHFQGYLFSPPLPEPEFLRWIAERRPDSGVQP
jgi:EAL domain-containing protein (putative c-di-GMP-specific phosphodiesterase class I)